MGPQRMYGLTVWVRRLLVANLLVFLLQQTVFTAARFRNALGFDPLYALQRPWTFLTYMFMHVGLLHLAFNLLILFMFGPSVEDRMGGRRFVGYYLLCGVGGALFSFLLMQWVPVGTIMGASGAILGVALAFAWYWPDHPVFVFPLSEPIPAKWLVTFFVGVSLVLAALGVSDGVAHLAHLGGIGTGLLILKSRDWHAGRAERQLRRTAEPSVTVSPPSQASRGARGSGRAPLGTSGAARGGARPDPEARTKAEIDRVLDKISASGVDSLTPAERRFLNEMSRRKRTKS